MKSRIDPDALERMAWETNYLDPTFRRDVVNDIKLRAKPGMTLSYRVECHSMNTPCAYDVGDRQSRQSITGSVYHGILL